MTDEMTALSRRAVACRGWRWMPGMRVMPAGGMVAAPLRLTDDYDWPHDLGLRLPDLSDPATLGCLLALVREAWRCPTLSPSEGLNSGWEVWLWNGPSRLVRSRGTTEAEALVAALESASSP